MEKISVILPCYIMNDQHIELTKNAVASLGDVELIVIDDASPMGGGYLRSIADIYVRNKENLGYGRSVNRGLRLAQSNLICISNNDIRISPNWQDVAREVLQDKDVYSCHFRMINYDEAFTYGDKVIKEGKERWCHASFFVINKKRWLLYYDEEYKNTYDDYDYFQTVRKAGFKQAYTNKAIFQHVHSATIPHIVGQAEVTKKNYKYFKEKWGEYPDVLFARDFPEQVKQNYWAGFD